MRLLLLLLSALFVPVSSRGWYFFGGDSGDGDTPFDPRQAAAGMSQQIVMSDSEKDEAMKANVDRSGHWRPQVHFSPPSNWLNDPNGLFLDSKGVWHMYYQCELKLASLFVGGRIRTETLGEYSRGLMCSRMAFRIPTAWNEHF